MTRSKNQKTINALIVLDRSGSMDTVREVTVSAFNEQLQTLRLAGIQEEVNVRVSLVSFNDKSQIHFWDRPIKEVHNLRYEDYVPAGGTAMYDAVGVAVSSLESIQDHGQSYLVVVISDGEENMSRVWNNAAVATLMQRISRQANWTVTYIGANQDLAKIRESWNIPVMNTMVYTNTREGTRVMSTNLSNSLTAYTASVSAGAVSSANMFAGNGTKDPAKDKVKTPTP